MSTSRAAARGALLALGAIGLAAACAHWPLAIWAGSLAAFGVPHALVELRWVAQRYGRERACVPAVLAVLGLIAGLRLLALPLQWGTATTSAVELGLGVLLVTCALVPAARPDAARIGVGLLLVAALAGGIAFAPVDALLVLAVVHNLTPLGFVADRLRDDDASPVARVRWLAAALLCFVVLPVWLATGVAADWSGLGTGRASSLDAAASSALGIGLGDGIAAFRPSWFPAERSLDLLRACAFLQCMHYVAVLVVMPRLGAGAHVEARSIGAARPQRAFFVLVGVLGAVFLAAFGVDFREAKATYGVLAAVHVWLEFPALLLALGSRRLAPVTP